MSDNTLINTTECAAALRCTPRHLRALIKARQSPLAIRIGTRYWFWQNDVRKYLLDKRNEAKKEWGISD